MSKYNGFSTIELLTTLFVAAGFIAVFYQLYLAVAQGNINARQQATASSLAYSNMRKYTTRPASFSGTNCSSNDLTVTPGAAGFVIYGSQSTVISYAGLPAPVKEYVLVFAPQGCTAGRPIKIESVVEFDSPSKIIKQATYVQ